MRLSTLDKEVEAARGESQLDKPVSGRPVAYPSDEPWPEAVDGEAILDELRQTFTRYVVLPEHADIALALWVAHTYTLNRFDVTPYLALQSPEKRCGKSTAREVLSALVARPQKTGNTSPAALFRLIEQHEPTLLIDETDAGLSDNDELRGILNDGYRRGGTVLRTVAAGDDFEVRAFRTFCPKALAGIGTLPGTIEDRSIQIRMRRKLPDEKVERLRLSKIAKEAAPLRQKTVRWIQDNGYRLTGAEPDTPDSLNDRAAEVWEPLLAIAEAVGGEWPQRAREAAEALSGPASDQSDSIRIELLADIRTLTHDQTGEDRISSQALADALGAMRDRPWSEWRGKPITPAALATQLSYFGIKPKDMKGDGWHQRGYEFRWFDDAFARYLPTPSATARQFNENKELGAYKSATTQPSVAVSNNDNPLKVKESRDVALSNPDVRRRIEV